MRARAAALLSAIAISFTAALGAAPPVGNATAASSPTTIDDLVREEMGRLDWISGFQTRFRVSDDGKIESHPVQGITISRPELEAIRTRSGVANFRPILAFLLAHEKAHQFQYRSSFTDPRMLTDAQKRVYECQADILGGKFMIETFGSDQSANEAILDLLQVAFDIGDREQGIGDHPTNEARRTAVRLGMACGTIVNLARLPRSPAVAQSMSGIASRIDYRMSDTVMGWSQRLAKRIVHYDEEAAKDLVVDDRDIQWDERASSPFVTYRYIYKNEGARPVSVDLEIQCASVPRTSPGDTKFWQKWSVATYAFRLDPGQTRTVSGTLPWMATLELMPSLVAPPRLTALMSCEYADGRAAPGPSRYVSSLKAVGATEDLVNLSNQLRVIGRELEGDPRALRGWVGARIDEETVVYPCAATIPKADGTDLFLSSDGTAWVSADLVKDVASGEAEALYSDIKARVASGFRGASVAEATRDSTRYSTKECAFGFVQYDFTVRLQLKRHKTSGTCTVSIKVDQPDR
jgi:hypothetical protein